MSRETVLRCDTPAYSYLGQRRFFRTNLNSFFPLNARGLTHLATYVVYRVSIDYK